MVKLPIKAECHLEGVHLEYEFKGGWRLSLVNGRMLHSFQYAWEIAVIKPDGSLAYDTPLTNDVEVFSSTEETERFIAQAEEYFNSL